MEIVYKKFTKKFFRNYKSTVDWSWLVYGASPLGLVKRNAVVEICKKLNKENENFIVEIASDIHSKRHEMERVSKMVDKIMSCRMRKSIQKVLASYVGEKIANKVVETQHNS